MYICPAWLNFFQPISCITPRAILPLVHIHGISPVSVNETRMTSSFINTWKDTVSLTQNEDIQTCCMQYQCHEQQYKSSQSTMLDFNFTKWKVYEKWYIWIKLICPCRQCGLHLSICFQVIAVRAYDSITNVGFWLYWKIFNASISLFYVRFTLILLALVMLVIKF